MWGRTLLLLAQPALGHRDLPGRSRRKGLLCDVARWTQKQFTQAQGWFSNNLWTLGLKVFSNPCREQITKMYVPPTLVSIWLGHDTLLLVFSGHSHFRN